MVRKINKNKPKEKKKKFVLRSSEEIDRQINLFLEHMKDLVPEDTLVKFTELTKDNASLYFMQKAFKIVQNFNRNLDKIDSPTFMENFKVDCELLILEYEKKYAPKPTTLYFCTLFAINKSISKYFRMNKFKKRFTKDSEDRLYTQEVYKFFNANIKTNPIQISKDRIFKGVFYEKICKLSDRIDDMLCRLNKLRETYIVGENIGREFDRIKNHIVCEMKEAPKVSKSERKTLERIFGKDEKGQKLVEEHLLPTHLQYKTEYNLLKDMILFNILLGYERNLTMLATDVQLMTNNSTYANNFASEIKALALEINVFFNNFERLVEHGIETFDETLTRCVGEVIEP